MSYDTDSGNEHWKVKNSWRTTWCANTMVRRAVSAHHGGVLYSDTNLMQSHMYIQRTNQDVRQVAFSLTSLVRAISASMRATKTCVCHTISSASCITYAVKFEDRSQEETERPQRCALSKAWNRATNIFKLKERDKATFYSPSEDWVVPVASTKEPEEREFVVDSGTSMHMVSMKDLNSAELETMRISRNLTTVMTANAKVQTREEATENVKGLDLIVTVMLLEETPAVLSLGKLCEDHGYTYHWTSGQKTQLTKK